MKKYFGDYLSSVSDIKTNDKDELVKIQGELSVKIAFLQHERLIHLLVTMLMAILLFISISTYILDGGIRMLPVIILLMGLECPYIAHYYFLENTCQKLYAVYDGISAKITGESTENEG